MALYVDTSALLKRYIEEPQSDAAEAYLLADTAWFSGRHTFVEVRRSLARVMSDQDIVRLRQTFENDWRRTTVVELDEVTCRLAVDIAEETGLRTLDALHLGAAMRLGPHAVTFVTFDLRQAQVARQLGFVVLAT
jgi:predicted nucleic acid-binding protein